MSIKKFGLTLSLFAAFGLMACGDDSSSGSNSTSGSGDDAVVHCTFTSDATSFKSVITDGDTTSTIIGKLEKETFTITYDGPDTGECEEDVEDADEGMKIECKDGREIMTQVVEGEEDAKTAFDESKKENEDECKDIDGKTKAELDDDDEDEDNDDEEGGVACDEQCQQELDNLNQDINEGFEENLEEMID